jgi:murein DD-endopeptidase MepM/ murein hydrolase activator NlpD
LTFFRPYRGVFPISQYWGNSAWGPNGEGGHPGTDYACPSGTQLIACADYEVIYAGPADGFGDNAISLWFPGLKAAATYGHGSAHYVKTGQTGKAGSLIGLSGWQGAVQPPGPAGSHLHFEIRYVNQAFGGNPPNVDSEEWLLFFEAMQNHPPIPAHPLSKEDIAKINAIRRSVGVAESGHWMLDDDLDRRLQTLRWHYLTPPNKLDKELIIRGFQKAMGLPDTEQDMIWGKGTDGSYNLSRLIFLGR